TIKLPPLRARAAAIVPLAEHFLARACADYRLPSRRLAPDARELLTAYPWPGNARELGNIIERTVLLTDGTLLTGAHLELPVSAGRDVSAPRTVESSERELARVLQETGWNITGAAARLGITRNTIRARIARARLPPAPPRAAPRGGRPRRRQGSPPGLGPWRQPCRSRRHGPSRGSRDAWSSYVRRWSPPRSPTRESATGSISRGTSCSASARASRGS